MSVSNQKKIKKAILEPCDKSNLYAPFNMDALQEAMLDLDAKGDIKLWLYFSKNQASYEYDLSREDCEGWGIKKDAYYDGLKRLIAKGYLVPINQKETIYVFVQRPSKHDKSEFAKID